MKAELKDKWLEALRCGGYKQTQGRLMREVDGEKRYCCLGVLADVANVPQKRVMLDFWTTLHPQARAEVGITYDEERILIEMNDGGRTFEDIANYIEENY